MRVAGNQISSPHVPTASTSCCFRAKKDSRNAKKALDGKIFGGRTLQIEYSMGRATKVPTRLHPRVRVRAPCSSLTLFCCRWCGWADSGRKAP